MDSSHPDINFCCYSEFIDYIPYFLSLVDNYSVRVFVDVKNSKIKLLGMSPNKARITCLEGKAIFENVQCMTEVNGVSFVCMLPQFSKNDTRFYVRKQDNNIWIGGNSTEGGVGKSPKYYKGELYSDWDGTGEDMYDYKSVIKDRVIYNIVKSSMDPEYAELCISVNDSSIRFKIEDEDIVKSYNYTGYFKENSEKVVKTVALADILELYDYKEDYFTNNSTFYFNKDSPIIIKMQQNGVKLLTAII